MPKLSSTLQCDCSAGRLLLEPGCVIGTDCPFLLQLEDDIVAKPNYLSTMKNFALQQPSEEWMILEFSQLGFIGKVSPLSQQAQTPAGCCKEVSSCPTVCLHEVVKTLNSVPPYFLQRPQCLHRKKGSSNSQLTFAFNKNKPGWRLTRQSDGSDTTGSF